MCLLVPERRSPSSSRVNHLICCWILCRQARFTLLSLQTEQRCFFSIFFFILLFACPPVHVLTDFVVSWVYFILYWLHLSKQHHMVLYYNSRSAVLDQWKEENFDHQIDFHVHFHFHSPVRKRKNPFAFCAFCLKHSPVPTHCGIGNHIFQCCHVLPAFWRRPWPAATDLIYCYWL